MKSVAKFYPAADVTSVTGRLPFIPPPWFMPFQSQQVNEKLCKFELATDIATIAGALPFINLTPTMPFCHPCQGHFLLHHMSIHQTKLTVTSKS
jgi:hypothetical protein